MASVGLYELSLVVTIGNVVMMLDTTHIIMITTGSRSYRQATLLDVKSLYVSSFGYGCYRNIKLFVWSLE